MKAMTMRSYVILLFTFSVSLNGITQLSEQDSLRVRELDKEARTVMMTDMPKALEACDEAISITRSDLNMILVPMTTKALIYFQHGEKDSSVAIMNNVIRVAKFINDDSRLSSAYRNLGQIEEYTGSYEKALENYILSNEAYQRSSEYEGHPNLYMTIGDLHFTLQNIPKAKENYEKGLELAPTWQNDKLIAEFEVKLAKIYLEKEEVDSAFFFATKANQYYIESGENPKVNDPREVLADIQVERGNLAGGIQYYEDLLQRLIAADDTRRIAYNAQKLGVLYIQKGDYNAAVKTLELSIKSNEKLQSPALADDYKTLANAYKNLGNYQKAFEFQEKYSAKYEELLNAEKLEQINDLQVKYDTEKKERENEKLSFELALKDKENKIAKVDLAFRNYLIVGIIVIALILFGVVFLIYNRRKVVHDNKMLKLEQKLLKTQMNPHFISNALMSAQGYIYDNKPKEASTFLAKIAQLTRLVLENSRKETISLEDEIATLENYLFVQQERYENFDFELNIDQRLDPEEIQLPPMLAQPFVENAIEHGIQNLPYRGLLQINFTTEEEKLCISIADNGPGIKAASKTKENHQSLSGTIVKERLQNLAEFHKQKLDFSITNNFTSKQHGEGTKVILTLPMSN